MPRAAMSVAISAVYRPDLNPSTAAERWLCVRSACSATHLMPPAASRRASLSAPRLVRTNTRLVPSARFRNPLSQSAFSGAGMSLPDVLDRGRQAFHAPHANHLRRAHDLARRSRHFVRHRGGKQQRLPVDRQRRHDAPHAGPESHVEHAIRLVEHEHLEALEIRRVGAHVIDQPAGRRDDDIGRAAQTALLRTGLHAAVDGDARQVRVIREPLKLVLDLHGQLSRRRQNQHPRRANLRVRRPAPQQAMHDRQQKRQRLAGSGLRAAHQVGPSSTPGKTALWIGVVVTNPRSASACPSRESSPSDVNATGVASYGAGSNCSGGCAGQRRCAGEPAHLPGVEADGSRGERLLKVFEGSEKCKMGWLARSESLYEEILFVP